MRHALYYFVNDTVSTVTAAFDTLAADYDALEARNSIFQWMRGRVQSAALSIFRREARILEVGCGTGTDVLFFAQRGHRVVAVDPSADMLAVTRQKIALAGFSHAVELVQSSAEHLNEVIERYGKASFEGLFSNFGALNCVADLRRFARNAALLLRPGGRVLISIMPSVCPWEMCYFLLRIRPREAFRRWRGRSGTDGISVRVGNQDVRTYYHSRATLAAAFSHAFDFEKQFALGLFVPPPYLHTITRYQNFFNSLIRCEELLAGWPLLRHLGDHVVVILRKRTI